MDMISSILSGIVAFLTSSNIVTLFYIKHVRKEKEALATQAADAVLYKRMEFLSARLDSLEEYIKTHTCAKAQDCNLKA